jgi:DNA-binding transcriptional LysR family regulator
MTDEGRSFCERVMPLVASLEEITASASGSAKTIKGRLRVNVDPFFSGLILAPRLGALLQSHPDLQLELISRDELGDMITDGFDVAIRFGHPRDSTLVARRLLETRIVTAAAPAYLQRYGRPKSPETWNRVIMSAFSSAIRKPADRSRGNSISGARRSSSLRAVG